MLDALDPLVLLLPGEEVGCLIVVAIISFGPLFGLLVALVLRAWDAIRTLGLLIALYYAYFGVTFAVPFLTPLSVMMPFARQPCFLLANVGLLLLASIGLTVYLIPMAAATRKQREPQRELCLRCGYNLTGNTSGVCPECGTPVK